MTRRQEYIFYEAPRRGKNFLIGLLVVIVILLAGLFTANLAMTHTVTYTKEYVTISNLPFDLDNFTILHLSDLNGAQLGDRQSAVKKAIGSRSSYGAVVLSGNMVGEKGDVQPLLDLLAQLPGNTPILLLPGDADPSLYATTAHASLSPYADWAQQLIDAGVTRDFLYRLGLEYRYLAQYLLGEMGREEMLEKLAIAIKQFAKRQMTWFRRNPDIIWLDMAGDYMSQACEAVEAFLKAE